MAISPLNTTTRLLGLSSGMDTESIVKSLMQIEQLKLNKQLRAQTTLQWRQDALKSVSTDMTTFRNTFLTALGADGMRTSGTYISYNVSMSGSKQDAVTIEATAEAAYKQVTVNKITSLATGASVKSSSGVSGSGKTELSQGNIVKLGDLDFANELFNGTTTMKIPKKVQATNDENQLMFRDDAGYVYYQDVDDPDVFYDVEGTLVTGVDVSTLKEVMTTASDAEGNPLYDNVQVPSNTIKFAINGVDFEFSKDTTLAQMLSTVNNSTAGVQMTYSRLTDGFSITSKETGAASKLVIENKHGNAFGTNSAFGIEEFGSVTKDKDGKTVLNSNVTGTNAVVYIEGVRVERSTNVFNIDGIKFSLNYTTGTEDVDADGKLIAQTFNAEDAVTAKFSQNVDASVDKIKKFIEGYNTMINKLHGLVNEKKNASYYALTDEEKSDMTENQIKEWEALAKSGLLRNDRDIQSVISQLRTAFYETVEGTGLSAQDIGLRSAYNSRSGEIELNETDLRAALERDPDAVMRVFMQTTDDYKTQGLTYRLENIIKTYTGTTQYNTLSSMDRDMNKLVDKISDMEKRMATIEERYYAKYAAMETALSKLQSQTNWISTMMGTSSK